jgi:CrcB protein
VVGTVVRAALETAFPAQPGGWPWATFAINVTGAFLLGLLLETLARRGPDAGARQLLRLGLGTGVMGGYTTYSTFAVETVRLLGAGAVLSGLGYALGTVLLGLAAALAGGRMAARLSP